MPGMDLEISRLLDVPRAKIWKAWTDPELLKEWWCPRPWKTQVKAFEFRRGGAFHTLMTGPAGEESDNPGCFLDIEPEHRIVWTSCLTGGWRPAISWLPMTAIISMADEGARTRYAARVMHKDEADRKRHEEMGFHEGWSICFAQLEEFARGL